MHNFTLNEINKDFKEWDKLLLKSNQSNVFFSSGFLLSTNSNIKKFFINKGEEVIGLLTLIVDELNQNIIQDGLVIHSGVLFLDRGKRRITAQRVEQFEVLNFVIEYLECNYKSVNINLSKFIEDIRPFLWFNYGKVSNTYVVNPRFTTCIDILQTEDKILKKMSQIRRQQIKYAQKENLSISLSKNISKFLNLYENNLKKNDNPPTSRYLKNVDNLVKNLLRLNMALLIECKNMNKEITYMGVFSIYNNKSVYLFGAPNIEYQNSNDGTYLIWSAIKILKNDFNIHELDLEGINSPKRGAFKLTFGGNFESYYNLLK